MLETSMGGVLLGNILLKYYNDPFSLKKPSNGELYIKRYEDLGYMAFGGVMFSYLKWLIEETTSKGVDTILFLARDSYVVMEMYKRYCRDFAIKAPAPIYLKTSRVMSMMMQIYDTADIKDSMKLAYSGSFQSFMEMRYGIALSEDDPNRGLYVELPDNLVDIKNVVMQYEGRIIENSKKQRQYYIEYLSNLNLEGKKIAFSDIGYAGSNQYFISRVLGEKYEGYYFNADMTNENPYYDGNLHALFQEEGDLDGSNSGTRKWTQVIEAVMTSPEGMYMRCDGKGGFIQDNLNLNQKHYSGKGKIHDGIWEYINDMQKMTKNMRDLNIREMGRYADGILDKVFSKAGNISEEIKSTFYVDNAIIGQKESRMF